MGYTVIPWLYSGLVQVDYEELMEGTFSPSVAEEIRKRGTLAAIFLISACLMDLFLTYILRYVTCRRLELEAI